MSPDLDKKLCEEFPLLFRDRNAPMTQTAMCWGFEINGDGWYNIIYCLCKCLYAEYNSVKYWLDLYDNKEHFKHLSEDELSKQIEEAAHKVKDAEDKIPIVTQVKEKYGSLSFYVQSANDEQYAMIHMAELLSAYTCEICGSPGKVKGHGWLKALCDTHATELNYD